MCNNNNTPPRTSKAFLVRVVLTIFYYEMETSLCFHNRFAYRCSQFAFYIFSRFTIDRDRCLFVSRVLRETTRDNNTATIITGAPKCVGSIDVCIATPKIRSERRRHRRGMGRLVGCKYDI